MSCSSTQSSFGSRFLTDDSLAYAEMRLILARILYAFDMELVDKGVDWLDQKVGVLWEKPPLRVYLTPVTRSASPDE